MKNTFLFSFFFIFSIFFCGGCSSPKIEIIQSCDNFSEDSVYNWGGSDFECRLYREGNRYYLESKLLGTCAYLGNTFVKDLGRSIKLDRRGLFFGSDGRMHIEYFDRNGRKCDASVPFGDIFGDKHISDTQYTKELPGEPYSEKYGVAGVLKREEPIIEEFLPALQKHIRNNDADAISKMLRYPLVARDVCLENRQDFLKYYPYIFTELIKTKLLKLQNKDIFCNYKGLMINYGMWFHLGGDDKAYFFAIHQWEY